MSKCVICESLAGSTRPVLPHDMADLVPDEMEARRRATLFLDHTTPDWEWFNMITLCDACHKRLYVTYLFFAGSWLGPGEAGVLDQMVCASRMGMPDEQALRMDATGGPTVDGKDHGRRGEIVYLPGVKHRARTRHGSPGAA